MDLPTGYAPNFMYENHVFFGKGRDFVLYCCQRHSHYQVNFCIIVDHNRLITSIVTLNIGAGFIGLL